MIKDVSNDPDLQQQCRLIPVKEIAAEIERMTGKRASRSAVWRWLLKGVRGRRLRSVLVAGQRYTTHADIHDFIFGADGLPQADRAATVGPTPGSAASIREAKKILDDAGI